MNIKIKLPFKLNEPVQDFCAGAWEMVEPIVYVVLFAVLVSLATAALRAL